MVPVSANDGWTTGGLRQAQPTGGARLALACAWLLAGCAAGGPPTISPSADGRTTAEPSPITVAGSVGAFCALLEPSAVATLLGAAVAESRAERSASGGAWCSYSTADSTAELEADEGTFLFVGFDRTANLQRWRPARPSDAAAAYAQRRSELSGGDPGQEVDGLGLAAWQGALGSAIAVFPPDVLVELSYDPRAASTDAAVAMLRGIGTALGTGVPADPGPVGACAIVSHEWVQADLGEFVDEVQSYDPFDPFASETELPPGGATACVFTSADPLDPLGVLTLAEVMRYRTDALRLWLAADASIGIASDEQRAMAAEMDAAGWVVPFFAGGPVAIAGTCQASWSGPSLFLLLAPDDVVVVRLSPDASQATATRLGGRITNAAESERGAPASCPPLGFGGPAMQRFGALQRQYR